MRTEIALHTTQTEARNIKKMISLGLTDAKIGRKDYHIREDKCMIVSRRKPLGMIGEKAETITSIHKI